MKYWPGIPMSVTWLSLVENCPVRSRLRFWRRSGVPRTVSSKPLFRMPPTLIGCGPAWAEDGAAVVRLWASVARGRRDDVVEDGVDIFLVIIREFDAHTVVVAVGVEADL